MITRAAAVPMSVWIGIGPMAVSRRMALPIAAGSRIWVAALSNSTGAATARSPASDQQRTDGDQHHLRRPPQPEDGVVGDVGIQHVLDQEIAPPRGAGQAEGDQQRPSRHAVASPHEPIGREGRNGKEERDIAQLGHEEEADRAAGPLEARNQAHGRARDLAAAVALHPGVDEDGCCAEHREDGHRRHDPYHGRHHGRLGAAHAPVPFDLPWARPSGVTPAASCAPPTSGSG